MNKVLPHISQYMTPMPYTIGPDANLKEALSLLEHYKIHHLPVELDGRIVGLLSQHDLTVLSAYSILSFETLKVSSAMSRNPYSVSPETGIGTVALHMAEQKLNAALVVQEDGALIGIFTDADALRALAALYKTKIKKEKLAPEVFVEPPSSQYVRP